MPWRSADDADLLLAVMVLFVASVATIVVGGGGWGLVLLLFGLTVIVGEAVLRRRRERTAQDRKDRGLCPVCGYDLRGSRHAKRCPECGERVD